MALTYLASRTHGSNLDRPDQAAAVHANPGDALAARSDAMIELIGAACSTS